MAKLLLKIPTDLNELSYTYSSQLELARCCINDEKVWAKWTTWPEFSNIKTHTELNNLIFMRNSWQLTSQGAVAFSHAFKRWYCVHDDNAIMTGRILLSMNLIMTTVWYSRGRHVYIWDENVHFEMQLVDGSLARFVDLKTPK
jgi:hypothetical protein